MSVVAVIIYVITVWLAIGATFTTLTNLVCDRKLRVRGIIMLEAGYGDFPLFLLGPITILIFFLATIIELMDSMEGDSSFWDKELIDLTKKKEKK